MSGMSCLYFLWKAHIGGGRRTWHAIMALGHHTRSDDVKFVIPLSPLDYTHDRATLIMACLSSSWTSHHTWSDDVRHNLYNSPWTHDRMTSGMACHDIPWTTHTVDQPRTWHAIITLGLYI